MLVDLFDKSSLRGQEIIERAAQVLDLDEDIVNTVLHTILICSVQDLMTRLEYEKAGSRGASNIVFHIPNTLDLGIQKSYDGKVVRFGDIKINQNLRQLINKVILEQTDPLEMLLKESVKTTVSDRNMKKLKGVLVDGYRELTY